ncbi:MAG: GNAT family N-acetyltransferase, partial [Candidatus Dormibacter sp.]
GDSLTGRSVMPSGGPRRRILLEAGDARLRGAATELLASAGFQVTVCSGHAPGHPCPLLAGQPCGLVAGADVVVHALAGPDGEVVLGRLRPAGEVGGPEVLVLTGHPAATDRGGEESLPATAAGTQLLGAVYRLHGTRARFLRLPLTLHDGRRVLIRAVRRDDDRRLREFDAGLSPRSRQLRYLGSKPPMTEGWAKHLVGVDFDLRFALVATTGEGEAERIVADCRLLSDEKVQGELAIVVADDHHGVGLGRMLVELTLRVAADRGLPEVIAEVRYDNRSMALLLRSEGFERTGWDLGVMTFARSPA